MHSCALQSEGRIILIIVTFLGYILEKLFIYLALAKPALPGQFDLLMSSQSKKNASNIFVYSDAQHKIKVVISEQHKNILLFISSTNFYYLFLSLPKIG